MAGSLLFSLPLPIIRRNSITKLLRENNTIRSLSSKPAASIAPEKEQQNDDMVGPTFHNRNPRNLEALRIAYKPDGYSLEKPGRNYWYKLFLEKSNRHITGYVLHHTGTKVVTASTREWCIKKHLYSTKDVPACENIGRILAQRCLESGISEVYSPYTNEEKQVERIKVFLNALEESGMRLSEPDVILPDYRTWKDRVEKPWEVVEEDVCK